MTASEYTITAASTPELVRRCFPAFRELRPHLDEDTFMQRWNKQAATGYEIVFIEVETEVVAAAGFRELTTMAWGSILYLDDLIALPTRRGAGYGTALLEFLQKETIRRGLSELHLDTGYSRHEAHRSYLRNRFSMICHHMSWTPERS